MGERYAWGVDQDRKRPNQTQLRGSGGLTARYRSKKRAGRQDPAETEKLRNTLVTAWVARYAPNEGPEASSSAT